MKTITTISMCALLLFAVTLPVYSAPTIFEIAFVDGDLAAGVLTIVHGLGLNYQLAMVYNNSGDAVMPDDINRLNANSTTVDLSAYGTITGTWYVVLVGGT